MKCPLCGGNLSVSQTRKNISDKLVQRDRSCDTPLCPYVERTYEVLETDDLDDLLEQSFETLRRIAKNIGSERIGDRLLALHREISGMK
ncbi:uncharacterized protein Dvar_53730 [Desulfosarcina variabilis str. Montpellier]|uniref:hypothetical protein n=1 Tax=Desulfosarcina variabilis TaxID=2300 RepID=UPI003AFB1AC3